MSLAAEQPDHHDHSPHIPRTPPAQRRRRRLARGVRAGDGRPCCCHGDGERERNAGRAQRHRARRARRRDAAQAVELLGRGAQGRLGSAIDDVRFRAGRIDAV